MSTKLCIQLSSVSQPENLEVEFLYNEDWTEDTEKQLIQKVHDILSLVRNESISLRLNLEINVKDPDHAIFLIKKKLEQQHELKIKNHKLSTCVIEILGLIMCGHTNHQIAEKLFISFETVRSHRKNIFEKTGVPNTATQINYYHQTFFEK